MTDDVGPTPPRRDRSWRVERDDRTDRDVRRELPPVPSRGYPIPPDSALVQGAVRDLAVRLGIDPAGIVVVEASAVTWPDSSCGCPQPGMGYLQRMVDGARVVLEADGHRHDYRGGTPLRWCAQSATAD